MKGNIFFKRSNSDIFGLKKFFGHFRHYIFACQRIGQNFRSKQPAHTAHALAGARARSQYALPRLIVAVLKNQLWDERYFKEAKILKMLLNIETFE